jgi:ribosomal protein L7/L12
MNEEALARQITALQTRVNQLERTMQQLLTILTTSGATSSGEQMQMQNMLRELQGGTGFSSQQRPEMAAIREALLAGNKIMAIKLYREVYGVGLKEAKDAIDVM